MYKKSKNQIKPKKRIITYEFILVFCILTAAFFYLYSINGNATAGYEIRRLEKEIGSLEKDGKQLQIKEAEMRSLYYIEERTKDLRMSEAGEVKYLEDKGEVALK